MSSPPAIRRARHAAEYGAARRLLLEYRQVLGAAACFQGFAAELDELRQRYGRGDAGLWLAWAGALPVGCVALAPAGDRRPAEIRRLYVRPDWQGAAVGRRLVEAAIAAAAAAGHERLRLETLDTLTAANRLYARLGFVAAAEGDGLAAGTRVLVRPLTPTDRPRRRAPV